ncbi:hypothetical protein BUE93_22110 [Chromobacterium amazonense]|uniref:Type 4 secretion system PilS N-terminal domain-containing protein n=1 Tax=Chromobacterium amazonense TaxID=1382803 RepID=A0A2S9WYF3_9NEIS|nr:prepilin-type N-terminal cleavage/methylation domain-containing protein [Chromobacterium amazonense]PRP68497.1 hypothetical protein BUE93_22110 [Chromobacterium amazonense]
MKNFKAKHRNKQRGMTLVELMIVLLIGAIVLIGVVMYFGSVSASNRSSKIVAEFSTAIPAIQSAYQSRTSFATVNTAQVAQNRWMSNEFLEMTGSTPTGNIMTQWGPVTFAPAASNNQVQVTMNNIPSRECIKISEMFNGDSYITASINGTSVKDKATSTMVDLDATGAQCNSSESNTMVFNFGRG